MCVFGACHRVSVVWYVCVIVYIVYASLVCIHVRVVRFECLGVCVYLLCVCLLCAIVYAVAVLLVYMHVCVLFAVRVY